MSKIIELFKSFDKDGNGNIDRNELQTVLQKLSGGAFDRLTLDRMFEAADLDGNNQVSYVEFVNWVVGKEDPQPVTICSVKLEMAGWHWALAVGADVYEVASEGIGETKMKVVGPRGPIARAEGAMKSRNESRSIDDFANGSTETNWLTVRSTAEIERFIRHWVRRNPEFTVFGEQRKRAEGPEPKHCRDFVRDLFQYVVGKKFPYDVQKAPEHSHNRRRPSNAPAFTVVKNDREAKEAALKASLGL